MAVNNASYAASDSRVQDLVRSLEASCAAIEADIARINIDLKYQEECYSRYGSDTFAATIRYLLGLREEKKTQYRTAIEKVEGLKHNIESSALLMAHLNHRPMNPNLQVNIIRSTAPQSGVNSSNIRY